MRALLRTFAGPLPTALGRARPRRKQVVSGSIQT